jgi:hypothetical protein
MMQQAKIEAARAYRNRPLVQKAKSLRRMLKENPTAAKQFVSAEAEHFAIRAAECVEYAIFRGSVILAQGVASLIKVNESDPQLIISHFDWINRWRGSPKQPL